MSQYLEIVEATDTFEFRPAPRTVFSLRIVPDDVEKKFRQKRTSIVFKHGQRSQDLDIHGFLGDVLQYAVVSWSGVRARGGDRDLELSRETLLALPESIKAEINRLCLGKEAGIALSQDEATEEKNG